MLKGCPTTDDPPSHFLRNIIHGWGLCLINLIPQATQYAKLHSPTTKILRLNIEKPKNLYDIANKPFGVISAHCTHATISLSSVRSVLSCVKTAQNGTNGNMQMGKHGSIT